MSVPTIEHLTCVGGPLDGKVIALRLGAPLVVPVIPEIEAHSEINDKDLECTVYFENVEYTRVYLKVETKLFRVLAPFRTSQDEVLEKLINNYRGVVK